MPIAAFLAAPTDANVPRCPQCGARLRQHVLWFDEMYSGHADYDWPRVERAARDAALVIFVGTSFSVGVTDFVLTQAVRRGRPVYSVDPGAVEPDPSVRVVAAPAEQALPALVSALAR